MPYKDPAKAAAAGRRYRAMYPERVRAANAAWDKTNPERRAAIERAARRRLRMAVLEAYGRLCACCGEASLEFLGIDHINGDGAAHRREVGSGYHVYLWLKRNGFPPGFRVLCHNCNLARGLYGYCPHEQAVEAIA